MAQKTHRIGIIGGSGLYQIPGIQSPRWRRVTTPFGDPSDQLLTGRLAGRSVVFLPRHARGHKILPSELNHRANIYAMRKLGARWIISCSAVGSLKKRLKPRDIVLIDQFIDRTKQSGAHTYFGQGIVAHIAFADPICPNLRAVLRKAAKKGNIKVSNKGTYVNMEGPAFSTRAESQANHRSGFDVIGMTNLGEARCAREAEIAYATIAMVTDYDAWKADEKHVSVDMIVENLHKNAESAKTIIVNALPLIPKKPEYPSHQALKHAIMTQPKDWPAQRVRDLKPILEPYL